MRLNMGQGDRIIRAVVAVLIGLFIFTGQITGTAAVVLGIIAAALLVTSIAGVCPGYLPFGLSTRRRT